MLSPSAARAPRRDVLRLLAKGQLQFAFLAEICSACASRFAHPRILPTPPTSFALALSSPHLRGRGKLRLALRNSLHKQGPLGVGGRETRQTRAVLEPSSRLGRAGALQSLRTSSPGLLCPALVPAEVSCRRGRRQATFGPSSFRGNWGRGRCRAAGKQRLVSVTDEGGFILERPSCGPHWTRQPEEVGWGSCNSQWAPAAYLPRKRGLWGKRGPCVHRVHL